MASKEYWRVCYEKDFKPAYDALMKFYPFTLEDLDGEQWADIAGYGGLYQVSNFGRVKSFKKNKEKILHPSLCRNGGYLLATLSKKSKTVHLRISRLVATYFISNPFNLPEVDHKNGVKLDNYFDNLQWVTSSQNAQLALQSGLRKSGTEHPDSKLTTEQILYIRRNSGGLSQRQLAEKFNVSQITIKDVQLGRKYKNVAGLVRQAKTQNPRVTDDIRAKIRAEYKKHSRLFGTTGLSQKYKIGASTVWKIIQEGD